MRLEFAVKAMLGHIEYMAEEVVAAGSRAGRLGRLHCKTAENQAFEKVSNCLGLTLRNSLRISKKVIQMILQQMPGIRNDRLASHKVGNHPLCTCRHLCGKVGISGSRHLLRSGSNHVQVRNNGNRSRTRECLLSSLICNRSPERCIAVNRCSSRQGQI